MRGKYEGTFFRELIDLLVKHEVSTLQGEGDNSALLRFKYKGLDFADAPDFLVDFRGDGNAELSVSTYDADGFILWTIFL